MAGRVGRAEEDHAEGKGEEEESVSTSRGPRRQGKTRGAQKKVGADPTLSAVNGARGKGLCHSDEGARFVGCSNLLKTG